MRQMNVALMIILSNIAWDVVPQSLSMNRGAMKTGKVLWPMEVAKDIAPGGKIILKKVWTESAFWAVFCIEYWSTSDYC